MSSSPGRNIKNELWFVLLPTIAGSFSAICSSCILYFTLRRYRRKQGSGRDDLLVGLCALDIISSVGMALSDFAAETKDVTRLTYIYGNRTTCKAQGFLQQFAVGIPLYYSALSVYFVSVIRCNHRARTKRFRIYFIRAVHGFILPVVVASAFAALFLGFYEHAGHIGCWINPPKLTLPYYTSSWDLQAIEAWFVMFFVLVPYGLSVFVTSASMLYLYCFVRKTEQRAYSWDPSPTLAPAERDFSIAFRPRTSGDRSLPPRTRIPPVSRQTREQGILYSGVLWICYPALFLLTIQNPSPGYYYEFLLVANSVLVPSHGTFNLLIYTRTTWVPKVREACAFIVEGPIDLIRQIHDVRRTTGERSSASQTTGHIIEEEPDTIRTAEEEKVENSEGTDEVGEDDGAEDPTIAVRSVPASQLLCCN